MRQAGRYLPEYRALRADKGGFLELVYDSAAAAEVTLQPLRRFGFDGAILFSDILIVPYAMGQDLWFGGSGGIRGDGEERKRSEAAGRNECEEASAVREASNWRTCRYNSSASFGQQDNSMLGRNLLETHSN